MKLNRITFLCLAVLTGHAFRGGNAITEPLVEEFDREMEIDELEEIEMIPELSSVEREMHHKKHHSQPQAWYGGGAAYVRSYPAAYPRAYYGGYPRTYYGGYNRAIYGGASYNRGYYGAGYNGGYYGGGYARYPSYYRSAPYVSSYSHMNYPVAGMGCQTVRCLEEQEKMAHEETIAGDNSENNDITGTEGVRRLHSTGGGYGGGYTHTHPTTHSHYGGGYGYGRPSYGGYTHTHPTTHSHYGGGYRYGRPSYGGYTHTHPTTHSHYGYGGHTQHNH